MPSLSFPAVDQSQEDVPGFLVLLLKVFLSHFGKGDITGLVPLNNVPGPLVYHQQVVVLKKDLQVFRGAVLRGIHQDEGLWVG